MVLAISSGGMKLDERLDWLVVDDGGVVLDRCSEVSKWVKWGLFLVVDDRLESDLKGFQDEVLEGRLSDFVPDNGRLL